MMQAVRTEEAAQFSNRLAELIPPEKLQEAIRIEQQEPIDALQTAANLLQTAKTYLDATQEITPSLRARLQSVLDALISALESILNAFGIADFFKPSESEMQAEFKAQKIMILLSLFSMLTSSLVPLAGAAMGGAILGITFLSIAALSLIYPFFRPAPLSLSRAENWTRQIQQGTLAVSEGRKETIEEIARTLIASKNAKTHVMLLGKSGIGKTETAKAFAQAVARGDYPQLQGKQVFYINTADLLNGSEPFTGGNKILTRISEEMGRHRENCILVFDEIHLACQKREHSVLSEQLKTLLDAGKASFPYVIAITTEEEYYRDIYANNPAFARRFKRIAIQNTETPETLFILNRFFLKKAPHLIAAPGAMETLLARTEEAFGKEAAQPATALKILSQCIKKSDAAQKSPLEIRIDAIRCRLQSFYSSAAVRATSLSSEPAAQLEKELSDLETALLKEKAELDAFFQTRSRLVQAQTALYRKIHALAKQPLSPQSKKALNAPFLEHFFFLPALREKVLRDASRLGVQTTLDASLIDQAIQEEKESERKAQEMVEQGKRQIEARAG